jgi:plasmid stabilization system protein ParE
MSDYQVIIRPEAEPDIEDTYRWYEVQRKGLGENFLLCIEEALSRVSRIPSVYSLVHENVRRILIHRFPFGIFFIVDEKKLLY